MTYNRAYHQAYYQKHKEHKKALSAKRRKSKPEAIRAYYLNTLPKYTDMRLRKVYGIGLTDYQQLFKVQAGVCAICKKPERSKRLAVDHDHSTKRVRGLLCQQCNQGLGHFKDDQSLLRRSISYLQNVQKDHRSR